MMLALCVAALASFGMVVQPSNHVRTIRYPELATMLNQPGDTTYVFNFWATWCKPCVKELPQFQALESEMKGKAVRVVFVSLDFASQLERVVEPFVTAHKVEQPVLLLDETDYNAWIDKLDSTWEGNLPATLVVNNARHFRKFYAHEFEPGTLLDSVNQLLSLHQQ